jgi:hypothetical protein
MKKRLLLSLTILTTAPVMADQCLPASQITITKSSSGVFTVSLPQSSGYTYVGQNYPINKTEPISFASAMVQVQPSHPDSKTVTTVQPISCWYGIAEEGTTGQYPGGIFILTKDGSQNKTITFSESWYVDAKMAYRCVDFTGLESTCSFTLSG